MQRCLAEAAPWAAPATLPLPLLVLTGSPVFLLQVRTILMRNTNGLDPDAYLRSGEMMRPACTYCRHARLTMPEPWLQLAFTRLGS